MALADILRKISEDASGEADEIISAAQTAAEDIRATARASATTSSMRIVEAARERAEAESQARRARARLAARDSALEAKREMVERVLTEAVSRLEGLPAAEYAALIAGEVARSSRGGERLLVAQSDQSILEERLPEALSTAGSSVVMAGTEAELARGVVLVGDRSRVEISAAAIVAARTDELTTRISSILFDAEERGEGA